MRTESNLIKIGMNGRLSEGEQREGMLDIFRSIYKVNHSVILSGAKLNICFRNCHATEKSQSVLKRLLISDLRWRSRRAFLWVHSLSRSMRDQTTRGAGASIPLQCSSSSPWSGRSSDVLLFKRPGAVIFQLRAGAAS